MMSINKMLIGGAAVFATVALIGCKDDDEDTSCDGYSYDLSTTPPSGALPADTGCLECVTNNGWGTTTGDTFYGVSSISKAVEDCGGSFTGTQDCKDFSVADQTELDASSAEAGACKGCMFSWDTRLTASVDVTSEYAQPAFEGCGGAAADWTVTE